MNLPGKFDETLPEVLWTIPSGVYEITERFAVNVGNRHLRVVGAGAKLVALGGSISIVGAVVSVEGITFSGVGVETSGNNVEIIDVTVENVEYPGTGLGAGLVIHGKTIGLTNIRVSNIRDPSSSGNKIAGLVLDASERIDAIGLEVVDIRGANAVGIVAPGKANVFFMDVKVSRVQGNTWAHGIVLENSNEVELRVIDVKDIVAADAVGIGVQAEGRVDVSFGEVQTIKGPRSIAVRLAGKKAIAIANFTIDMNDAIGHDSASTNRVGLEIVGGTFDELAAGRGNTVALSGLAIRNVAGDAIKTSGGLAWAKLHKVHVAKSERAGIILAEQIEVSASLIDGMLHGPAFGSEAMTDAPIPQLSAASVAIGDTDALDALDGEASRSLPKLGPDPAIAYTARDAAAFLALMLERARTTMPVWKDEGPADIVRVLFELFAERLDHLSYMQERAVTEGFLDQATRRRSVEDHARAVDCQPDPGLTATVMLEFNATNPIRMPKGTLVANRSTGDEAIVFTTEQDLDIHSDVHKLLLVADCPIGATHADIVRPSVIGLSFLHRDRWLVARKAQNEQSDWHVVRITSVEVLRDRLRISWDPRRPLLFALERRAGAYFHGNVVPAHQYLELSALDEAQNDDLLKAARSRLSLSIHAGPRCEIRLPFEPLSYVAPGYPRPDDRVRQGEPFVRVRIEGDEWHMIEELSIAGPNDQVFVLRATDDGGTVLRFGDGVSGMALPSREVNVELSLAVGLGRRGNIGAKQISRILRVGADPSGFQQAAQLEGSVTVTNPEPAVEGRDAEPLEALRYRAARESLVLRSAVTPGDYERLVEELPEVAKCYARVDGSGLRPLVKVTVLLRDQDVLEPAELLRRWALVRERLGEIRLLGVDVEVLPPTWVPLDLAIRLHTTPHASSSVVRDAAEAALVGQGGALDPDTTGLGGDVHVASLYRALLAVPGVHHVEITRCARATPNDFLALKDGSLPMAPHEVAVVQVPGQTRGSMKLSLTITGGRR